MREGIRSASPPSVERWACWMSQNVETSLFFARLQTLGPRNPPGQACLGRLGALLPLPSGRKSVRSALGGPCTVWPIFRLVPLGCPCLSTLWPKKCAIGSLVLPFDRFFASSQLGALVYLPWAPLSSYPSNPLVCVMPTLNGSPEGGPGHSQGPLGPPRGPWVPKGPWVPLGSLGPLGPWGLRRCAPAV